MPRRHQTQTERDLAALERLRAENAQADELQVDDGTPIEEMDDDSSRTPVTTLATELADNVKKSLDRPGGMAGPLRGITITQDDRIDVAIKETLKVVARHLANSEERARKAGKAEDIDTHGKKIADLETKAKIVQWVGVTLATFVLASSIVVARMLFGWGRDDETVRAGVDRCREQGLENKADIKDLRGTIEEIRRDLAGMHATMGSRRGNTTAPPAPAPIPDGDHP